MRVLSIGECMAELSPSDHARQYRLGFAGDTFNTAWYLARIAADVEVGYFTALGGDALSQDLRAFMRESRIDDSLVRTLPDKTIGMYLISLEKGERSFTYWRGQSAARELAQDAGALADAMRGADLIYFSGITLAILDAGARRTLIAALREARTGGRRIAFDPNLRPRLWASPEAMTAAIMAGAAVSDIALPSFEDEAQWFQDATPAATIERYAAAGASCVVVKNGDAAVSYLEGGERGEVPVTPAPSVVDTTAAGDSFNAAVLAGVARQSPLREAIADACHLAGQVVQGRGALVPVDPGILRADASWRK